MSAGAWGRVPPGRPHVSAAASARHGPEPARAPEFDGPCPRRRPVLHGRRSQRRAPTRRPTHVRRATSTRSPWAWIPTLYFAEGLPYVVVMTVSVIMYKRLGISNTDIALYTSWLYLPWVIKPLWSPVVDLLGTQAALDLGDAVRRSARRWRWWRWRCRRPHFLQLDARRLLADGVRLGHARHRRRRLLHAGAAASSSRRRSSACAARSTGSR